MMCGYLLGEKSRHDTGSLQPITFLKSKNRRAYAHTGTYFFIFFILVFIFGF